jgi:hypothetical protein
MPKYKEPTIAKLIWYSRFNEDGGWGSSRFQRAYCDFPRRRLH